MNAQSEKPGTGEGHGHGLSECSHTLPPVGTLQWERAGGPPLSFGQKLSLLGGAGAVVLMDLGPRLKWLLSRWGMLTAGKLPEKIDLSAWAPPDTRAARDAENYLREVSSGPMINHSLRTYYFSGIMYSLSGVRLSIDREALYVAAVLHDVGLFQASPPANEHCFSVGSAREARRIARDAGWDEARQDRIAVAITTNLNPFVPLDEFGPEAHFMSVGGLVEVIAQEWNVHPANVTELLKRFPREGFAAETVRRVRHEAKQNPGSRFACLNPMFTTMVRLTTFSTE
ncbi:MAG: HD domain-containing protein [Desulfomonilia bacterium]|jgi:hypothetical protein